MLAAERVLTLGDARRFVAGHGFGPADPAPDGARLGIEIEWQTVSAGDAARPIPFDLLRATARNAVLPGGSRLTFEPGGQVELSSRALPGFEAHAAIVADARALIDKLAQQGIALVGVGLLPGAARERLVHSPRYDAMEAHFDASGPEGRTMMRQTAAVQVNVDLGPAYDVARRWRFTHALGPVLAAAFANSPFRGTEPSGWRSTRLAVWLALERGRAVPSDHAMSPAAAWASYALRAPLMFIRAAADDYRPVRERVSFAEWILGGHALGWPTEADLEYHLTTLFPPVRPRGWLELRMIDALPLEWATVPASVVTGLLDPTAFASLRRTLEPVADRWEDAARDSLHDPTFAAAAEACFNAAVAGLARLGAPTEVVDPVLAFRDRYVERGRCPADDLLDEFHRCGRLVPAPEPDHSFAG
jgi:glutamate--cysteine ligase